MEDIMKKVIKNILVLGLAIAVLGVTACQSKSEEPKNQGQTEKTDVKVLRVGVPQAMKPYGYIDENGEQKGFDVAFLKAVDERLEDVEFEIISSGLTDHVLSLESGKLDLISYQLGKNPEREEKFVFSSINYSNSGMKVVVRGDVNDINGLEDLQGKVLSMNPTEVSNAIINKFNEEHSDNPIIVEYRDASVDAAVLVATGKVDAMLSQPVNVKNIVENAGLDIKVVGDYINGETPVWHMWRKDEALTPYIEKFDQVVMDMLADGSLAEISIEWLGEDYTNKK